jgi:hypothetical protein
MVKVGIEYVYYKKLIQPIGPRKKLTKRPIGYWRGRSARRGCMCAELSPTYYSYYYFTSSIFLSSMPPPLVLFVALASTLLPQLTESFSKPPTPDPRPSPKTSPIPPPPIVHPTAALPPTPPGTTSPTTGCDFRSFEFDPATGICRRPSTFRYDASASSLPRDDVDVDVDDESQYFVMRNVPGDGDCVFHAVLGSVFVSMGMINPDSDYSDTVHAMALEMRRVVANFLSSPDGTLYVNNKPRKRIVRCRDLLASAAMAEGMSCEEYLTRLRRPGKVGGLYGGGPELTVLSNILRRPISIFHLKQRTGVGGGKEDNCRELQRMGVFGEGLFEDSCNSIPDSVVTNAVFFTVDGRGAVGRRRQEEERSSSSSSSSTTSVPPSISSPLKCSWHLNILIADAGDGQKHACVLLPSVPILHNDR